MKSKVDQIIDGLIRLGQKIAPADDWVQKHSREMVGRTAQIQVWDLDRTYPRRLRLGPGFTIQESQDEPYHVIGMDIDTFTALLSGDLDWGQAWTEGKIEFDGPDFVRHAMLWAKAFRRYRGYLQL